MDQRISAVAIQGTGYGVRVVKGREIDQGKHLGIPHPPIPFGLGPDTLRHGELGRAQLVEQ